MEKGFRGTDGDLEPVPFECKTWGYPYLTSAGEVMYTNTHFRTEQEAWDSILASWDAGVSLLRKAKAAKKVELRKLRVDILKEIHSRAEARRRYRVWRGGQK